MFKLAKTLLILALLGAASLVHAELLDINTATAEQLDTVLVGIGKAKAEAIIHDREKNGPFKSVDDLERVSGIGPATLAKNRDKITVGAPTPPAAPPTKTN